MELQTREIMRWQEYKEQQPDVYQYCWFCLGDFWTW